jgi:RNA polymerase sigma-32 factor
MHSDSKCTLPTVVQQGGRLSPPYLDGTLSSYLYKVNSFPSLSAEEEFSLAKTYVESGDVEAAQKLVKSYLKLVAKLALSYRQYNVPIVDLISEGNLGLIRAVRKYKPELGHRLSTYATWWIKAMLQDYVLKSWSLVKIITTAQQKRLFFALRKLKRQIANSHLALSYENYAQIAQELDMQTAEVQQFHQRLSSPDVSLNQPSGSNNSIALIECIPETRPNQENLLVAKQEAQIKKGLLRQALASLNERERHILETRWLLNEPETLQTLSDKLKISKERVRQIETQALSKIKEFVKMHGAGLLDIPSLTQPYQRK